MKPTQRKAKQAVRRIRARQRADMERSSPYYWLFVAAFCALGIMSIVVIRGVWSAIGMGALAVLLAGIADVVIWRTGKKGRLSLNDFRNTKEFRAGFEATDRALAREKAFWSTHHRTVTRADVERIVRRDFPPEQFDSVIAVLDEYTDRERDRVQLAALKLADGNLARIREVFNSEWRDILADAEYPNSMQYGHGPNRPEGLAEQDWAQYQAWFER